MMQRISARSARSTRYLLGFSAIIAMLALPATSVGTEPAIHRCVQEDGTVSFQELPCPEAKETGNADDQSDRADPPPTDEFFDFVNPYDQPEQALAPTETAPPVPPSEDRAECEKSTRDAIDAIDLELRKNDSRDAGREYLAKLMELTRQLRSCKQL